MELYLDSANLKEIEEASKLGFLAGLTTTPTFMQREGVKDIDATIVSLSKLVPILQIEALGNTAEEILKEAKRQLALGLNPKRTVFKIPVSMEGIKACKLLRDKGFLVNIHLVYTLQQAYLAMNAGATYVCPLVGRLQDQGHDALALVEECVSAVNYYKYPTKIMFSSVRHNEHVRNAINIGAHALTVPMKVLQSMTENHFTALGTEQFIRDTKLMTVKVKDVIRKSNPLIGMDNTVSDAIVKMTESGLGAVTVINKDKSIVGVFTDGDIRRNLLNDGRDVLKKKMKQFTYKSPVTIDVEALLNDAYGIFKLTKVDNILVTKNGKPVGMLDIQDIES